jgi:hypothetical protein
MESAVLPTGTPSKALFDKLSITESRRTHARKETAGKVARDAAERARAEYWNKYDWLTVGDNSVTFSPVVHKGKRQVASKRSGLSALKIFEDVQCPVGSATPKRQPFSKLSLTSTQNTPGKMPGKAPAQLPTPLTQVNHPCAFDAL